MGHQEVDHLQEREHLGQLVQELELPMGRLVQQLERGLVLVQQLVVQALPKDQQEAQQELVAPRKGLRLVVQELVQKQVVQVQEVREMEELVLVVRLYYLQKGHQPSLD